MWFILNKQFDQLTSEIPPMKELLESVKKQVSEINSSSSPQEINILNERIQKSQLQLDRLIFYKNFIENF